MIGKNQIKSRPPVARSSEKCLFKLLGTIIQEDILERGGINADRIILYSPTAHSLLISIVLHFCYGLSVCAPQPQLVW